MLAGLECFDENGEKTLSLTSRITRVIGSISTPHGKNKSGSINVPELLSGNPWFFVYIVGSGTGIQPKVSVSGSVLSWSSEGDWSLEPCIIYYGVF